LSHVNSIAIGGEDGYERFYYFHVVILWNLQFLINQSIRSFLRTAQQKSEPSNFLSCTPVYVFGDRAGISLPANDTMDICSIYNFSCLFHKTFIKIEARSITRCAENDAALSPGLSYVNGCPPQFEKPYAHHSLI